MRSTTMMLAAALSAALAGRALAQPAESASPTTPPDDAADDAGDDPPAEVTGADEPGTSARPGEAIEPEAKAKKPKDKAKADAAAGAPAEPPELEVSGRVFLRGSAYDDDLNPWVAGFSLDSARIQLNYQWRDRVAAEVSAEVRSRGSIRDAFLDIRVNDCTEVRAGRFKQPASAIERTSTWTLPTIDRPITATILDAGMAVSGRRNGIMAIWRQRTGLQPRIEAAVGQSMDLIGEEAPRFVNEGAGLTATLRGELRPYTHEDGSDVRFGAFGQTREF